MPAVGGAERREAGLEGAVCAMSGFIPEQEGLLPGVGTFLERPPAVPFL